MLAGLTILRYVFDSVLAVVDMLRKSSAGDAVPLVIKQDVSEMKEISASFSRLMDRLEKTTEALDRRVYELNAIKEMTDIARKTLHVEELLKAVLEKAMAVVQAKVGSVYYRRRRFKTAATGCFDSRRGAAERIIRQYR
ncbi:MAG: hypothetical protein Q7I89_09000 [Syntrophales bacterium]|nr:hypothetical protein [Syntrophales bacterium]